jgi:hypothetical protein
MSIVLLAILEARRSLPHWSEPYRWNRGLSTTNVRSWPIMATCRPPTALFVLERLIQSGLPSRTLLTAMGPGFTASCVSLRKAS